MPNLFNLTFKDLVERLSIYYEQDTNSRDVGIDIDGTYHEIEGIEFNGSQLILIPSPKNKINRKVVVENTLQSLKLKKADIERAIVLHKKEKESRHFDLELEQLTKHHNLLTDVIGVKQVLLELLEREVIQESEE